MQPGSLRASLEAMFAARMDVFTFPTLEHPSRKGFREWIYFACGEDVGRSVCLDTCRTWRAGMSTGPKECVYVAPGEDSVRAEYANSRVTMEVAGSEAAATGALQPHGV
jgi:hypothetical protein